MKRETARLVADGFYREALSLYAMHHSASQGPHKFTFPPLFKACAKLNSSLQGQMIHGQLIKTGFQADVYAATALTDMYMKLHCIDDALYSFGEMPERNSASLNAMISGFSQNRCSTEAFWTFKKASLYKLEPNTITVASLLSACEIVANGMELHCWATKLGFETDVYVSTALLTMYINCGKLVLAAKVFEEMSNKNVVTYNAFISGLLLNSMPLVVQKVFKQMRERSDLKPDLVTLASVLSACSGFFNLRFGRQVHGFTSKIGIDDNAMVGTALVDMYSKCGAWQCAYKVFKELSGIRNLFTWNAIIAGVMLNDQCEFAFELFGLLESEGLEPDSVTWNSMISKFSQEGRAFEAFKYFNRMQSTGLLPNLKCLTSLLPACSDLSALRCGKEIHSFAIKRVTCIDEFFATALIDMYMKCGHSSWARKIFDQFDAKPDDPAFWNAMISGYGRNGENESAFEIFHQMLAERVKPNLGTFTSVLSVCSHTGLVDKGWQVFRMMKGEFGLQPNSDHYGCMVDLLSRCGLLDKARELIQELSNPSTSIFASLLGACRCYLDSELGEEMALRILELEPENPTPLVILSNIYAALGRWRDVERIREVMDDKNLRKQPGSSTIEVMYNR